ncbi:MurR/RpiR family transcriptional regulator [Mesorhizobium sp. B4-1-4]|uniref:MurR/RpiR family transcriptional regulator n=1 Tax=Mesorhizobium sp. B4-1-4 TaxID=2589888 RepID=UPI0015E45C4B|nr:MurR/RpiR family transcriptional regulator [Mesorhizobium sp. B4-1-4]
MAQELRRNVKVMSRAERRIARALFLSNFEAGLMSVANLAALANVSGPTVIRFTTTLGYSSYKDFQNSAARQHDESIESPATLYERVTQSPARPTTGDVISSVLSRTKSTLEMIDIEEFDKIARILGDRRRNLYTLGGQSTVFFADLLAARLFQVRPSVQSIRSHSMGFCREDLLPFIGNRDVLFAFDFRRYQKSTIEFCQIAAEQDATVILMTDMWLSPIADFASQVLVIDSETDGPYDFLTPCMALLDTLQEAVLANSNFDEVRKRIRLCEKYPRGLVGEEGTDHTS